MSETHLYRLWHGDNNNRSEIARFKAEDFENVSDYVRKELIKPESAIIAEFGDEISLYLDLDVCKGCEVKLEDDFDEDDCEHCETAEYVQIEQDDDIEADFKTIYGTNDYYDLTKPKGEEKSPDWSPELKRAWDSSALEGSEALIAKTVEDNPEMTEGIDPELLKRGRRALKGGADK